MNQRIIKLGLDSGMLNYVDHETPRHYFLCGNADEECLKKFAKLIVLEVLNVQENLMANGHNAWHLHKPTKKHFGIEE